MNDIVRRWRRLSWPDRLLLGDAVLTLSAASLAIRLAPFRAIMKMAGAVRAAETSGSDAAADAKRVRWAVQAASARVPWRTVCFQRGLAAHWMMRRRALPSLFHYGIANRDDGSLEAHVWVTAAGIGVVGTEEAARFAEVAVVPAPERHG